MVRTPFGAQAADGPDKGPKSPPTVPAYLTVQELAQRMRCCRRTNRPPNGADELEAAVFGARWVPRDSAVEPCFQSNLELRPSVP